MNPEPQNKRSKHHGQVGHPERWEQLAARQVNRACSDWLAKRGLLGRSFNKDNKSK